MYDICTLLIHSYQSGGPGPRGPIFSAAAPSLGKVTSDGRRAVSGEGAVGGKHVPHWRSSPRPHALPISGRLDARVRRAGGERGGLSYTRAA